MTEWKTKSRPAGRLFLQRKTITSSFLQRRERPGQQEPPGQLQQREQPGQRERPGQQEQRLEAEQLR